MVKLKIISCESKSGATGNFVRCNTNQGWLSAFEEPTKTLILQSVGKELDVEITEKKSGDKTYRNIVSAKLCDATSQNVELPALAVGPKGELGTITKTNDKPRMDTSFYTAYAKDVFVALIADDKEVKKYDELMMISIDLIKQARKAFE